MTVHEDEVVLLDEAGTQVGTAAEAAVHTSATPLHLAFSAYVIDLEGQVLVGRRARWKSTWPRFWTNSCSGHPCPGEKLPAAVARRVDEVLGIIPADITLILPDFRCRTVTKAGILENSICPVYRVTVHRLVHPDPNEVEILAWIPWTALVARAGGDARSLTPCCREQVRRLRLLGPDPRRWQASPNSGLPPAARTA